MNVWQNKDAALLTLAFSIAASSCLHSDHIAETPKDYNLNHIINEIDPLFKQRLAGKRERMALALSQELSHPKTGETLLAKEQRLTAKSELDAQAKSAKADIIPADFEAYKLSLPKLETRLSQIVPSQLSACRAHALFSRWGQLRLWAEWSERYDVQGSPDQTLLSAYKDSLTEFTGRAVTFDEVVAVGEAEYVAVKKQLNTLAARVEIHYAQSLDEFAARPEHFSLKEADILSRTQAKLKNIENSFAASGDFSFAPVKPASVEVIQTYGPRYSVASYSQSRNAAVLYWPEHRYNHVYDTLHLVHEIMPGHHLQMSMETQRRCGIGPISSGSPFIEGWATYAEFLAEERGLFRAPDQRLGWLDYRLIRAMRIIIDTARVEDSLSEKQAQQIWQRRMPKRLHRYFPREWARINTSPYHLSYIFGSQAILSARGTLQKTLGPHFSEADFHAALLNSPHPDLMFLAERMEAQMRAVKPR